MDNELLYCGIENHIPCFYSSLYLSIFLSFKAKFVSQFTPELCKLESLYMVYIMKNEWLYRGIETQGYGFCFSIFHPFFFLSLYYMLTLKIFMLTFSQELLKSEC